MPNCKVGELAIVVHSECANEGKIVTCVRWIGTSPSIIENWANDWWEVDIELNSVYGVSGSHEFDIPAEPINTISDHYLRPLRGGPYAEEVKELEHAIQGKA